MVSNPPGEKTTTIRDDVLLGLESLSSLRTQIGDIEERLKKLYHQMPAGKFRDDIAQILLLIRRET